MAIKLSQAVLDARIAAFEAVMNNRYRPDWQQDQQAFKERGGITCEGCGAALMRPQCDYCKRWIYRPGYRVGFE